jgi:DNA polymerase III delta prime subunit
MNHMPKRYWKYLTELGHAQNDALTKLSSGSDKLPNIPQQKILEIQTKNLSFSRDLIEGKSG